ncbi:MAG: penicillin-binding protein 1C, partial [bacterium]
MKRSHSVFLILFLIVMFVFVEIFVIPFPEKLLSTSRATSIKLTDRLGELLREKPYAGEKQTDWLPLNDISVHAIHAAIATEDSRFYDHHGIDFRAIVRAALTNMRAHRVVSGGSTITQQLVRNLRPARRSILNKLVESLLALRLERRMTKEQILFHYLNRIPYGNGAYGIGAAARLYFNKRASNLTVAESAFLAGLPKSPSGYNPFRHPERARKRFLLVLKAMRDEGYIPEDVYEMARSTKLALQKTTTPFLAPHFTEYVLESAGGGSLVGAGAIRTTIDLELQSRIEGIVRRQVSELAHKELTNAAVVVIENRTGEILAMVGSADFFNLGNEGMNNGALARRQPGSAIKPFTYAISLEKGFTPATILPDLETHFSTPDGDFMPRNYDLQFHGPVRLRMALANSLNVASVNLAYRIGTDIILHYLRRLGITSLDKNASYYGLGITLGNGEISLLELTHAYSVFPNLGELLPLKSVLAFTPPGKKEIPFRSQRKKGRIFSPQTAYIIADILSDRDARSPTFGISTPLNLPFRTGVKTGTSSSFRDNWTVGFTREVTVGVWCGNFSGKPMEDISGITGAGPIFRDVMRLVMEKYSKKWLRRPPRLIAVKICPVSGLRTSPHCGGEI